MMMNLKICNNFIMKKILSFFCLIAIFGIPLFVILAQVVISHGSTNKNSNENMRITFLGTKSDNKTMMQGDCIIITVGDVQILIDSCQTSIESAKKIKTVMQEAMAEDDEKVWDYIIFTHPDNDHIGNYEEVFKLFYNSDNWKIKNIIDYDIEEIDISAFSSSTSEKPIAPEYRKARTDLLEKHKDINYFSASSLTVTDLIKEFQIFDNLSLNVLYNMYDTYDQLGSVKSLSSNQKNNMSVCMLLKYGNQKEILLKRQRLL